MSFRPPDLRTVPLPILRQDARWVAVNKPSGLLSVPAKDPAITDNVRVRVEDRFPTARGPMTVHRLDMETSGIMLLALDSEAHRNLSIQFQERVVRKQYIAVVNGSVTSDDGIIRLPLRLDVENRPYQIADPVNGKHAETHWRVLSRATDRTRLLLEPHTGRTHQLRVHCAHPQGLGAPILGDRLYGEPSSAERLLLHATHLGFQDPTTSQWTEIHSEAPF